jgi:hypothetical protein
MSIQLKVNRLELISKLETARDKADLDFVNAVNAYDAEVEAKTKVAIKKLKAKLAKGDIEFTYSGAKVSVDGKDVKLKHSSPSKPNHKRLEEQLRNLKLATNETLTISDKSDYFRYL